MTTRLPALLHLCDSLFPTGAFAHSDGLEAATAAGYVHDAATLRGWMETCLDDTLAGCEAPAVLLSRRAFAEGRDADLRGLDAEIHAMRPSSTARRASRAMGGRLLNTWHQLYPAADPGAVLDASDGVTFPVAFGIVSASAGIDDGAALIGFMYTRLAATASAAMRLMPIGQHDAHGILASLSDRLPPLAQRICQSNDPPRSFAPAMDLALMSQQYVHSRLFRS